VLCDSATATDSKCLDQTEWLEEPGFSTSLEVSYRRATVAFSRFNGTILQHTFEKSPTTATPIAAADLLFAFDTVFHPVDNSTMYYFALTLLKIENNVPTLPLYLWWWFHGLGTQSNKNDAAAKSRAVGGLQSLLALPIYHCQAKQFAELKTLGYDNNTSTGEAILSLFPEAERDTPIVPANLGYDIVVGRDTLLAYITLGSITLALCYATLIVALFTKSHNKVGQLSLYPTLNFMSKTDLVLSDSDRPVPKARLIDTGAMRKRRMMRSVQGMTVKLAHPG
jgi:hypothetical protein